MASADDDPWNWSVAEVVDRLTAPNGLIKAAYPSSLIDLSKLANTLCELEMVGEHLLCEIHENHKECLKEDFGLIVLGQRRCVLRVVRDLQDASRKFKLWRDSRTDTTTKWVEAHDPSPLPSTALPLSHRLGQSTTASFNQDNDVVADGPLNASPVRSWTKTENQLGLDAMNKAHINSQLTTEVALAEYEVGTNVRGEEKLVTDKTGRPRRKLQFPVQPGAGSPATYTATKLPNSGADSSAAFSRQSPSAPLTESMYRASDTYLGPRAVPIDALFYGTTPIGGELPTDDPPDVTVEDPEIKLAITLSKEFGVGHTLYVNSRMKYFFGHNNAMELGRLFKRRKHHAYGIKPYPDRLVRSDQSPSITIISGVAYKAKAYRQNGNCWKETSPYDLGTALLPFNPSPSDTVEMGARHDGNGPDDLSSLEKYMDMDDDSPPLPAYGDSDVEDDNSERTEDLAEDGDVDEDDMAEEEDKDYERLSPAEVSKIRERSKAKIEAQWTENRLPKLAKTAFKLWNKSRSQRTMRMDVEYFQQEIRRLEKRLSALEANIQIILWDKAEDVEQQCRSLESTIEDCCKSKWSLSVIQQKNAPPRPDKTDKTQNQSSVRPQEFIPADNLTMHDDGPDDFIDDEYYSPPENLIDIYHSTQPGALSDNPMTGDHTQFSNADETLLDATDQHEEPGRGQPNANASMSNRPDNFGEIDDTTEDLEDAIISSSAQQPRPDIFDIIPSPSSDQEGDVEADKAVSDSGVSTASEGESPGAAVQSSPGLNPAANIIKQELNAANNVDTESGFIGSGEIIDLTQLSDMDLARDRAIPRPMEGSERLATPEAPIEFPRLMSSGRVRPQFKAPPTSQVIQAEAPADCYEIINATDKPASGESEDVYDVEAIAGLSPEELYERGDTRRMLIWILSHEEAPTRNAVMEACKGRGPDEISPVICKALSLLKKNHQKIRGEENSYGLMKIAIWFTCWNEGRAFNDIGIKPKFIQAAIDSLEAAADDFVEFYNFLHERLLWHAENDREKAARGSDPSWFKKRKLEGSMTSETRIPKKKRKKVIRESELGRDLQQAALVRAKERERRKVEVRELQTPQRQDDQVVKYVNLGNSSVQSAIALHPEIAKRIQSHQLDGVIFMWSEIVTAKAGCLLAHPMGLGKTMQVITLLVTIADAANHVDESIKEQIPESLRQSRTLILCPAALVDNWVDELLKWIPESSTSNIGEIRKITSSLRSHDRLFEIQLWAEEGGILVLSYSIFRALVMPPKGEHKAFDEQEAERLRKHLLDLPNLVIADEAQEIKNKKSKAFLAANMIQTKCRIALTGSPLSNNLEEYYNLVDWIQEGYLGPMDEFRIKYIEPISEGLYVDASNKEKREGLKMLKVLTRVLGPKMDRPDYSVLHKQLHGKTEFVIRVPLSELQDRCYRLYVRNILTSVHDDKTSQALLWAWLAILTVLNNHPKAFYRRLLAKAGQKEKSGLETPADEFSNKGIVSNAELEQASQELAEDPRRILGVSIIQQLLQVLEAAPDLNEVAVSSKMDLLFQILRGCIQANEKVLIFSHSLVTLDFIEAQLKAMGEKYYRIDGAAEVKGRQQQTKDFNAAERAICLISTRAGGTGLNLHGASRVIIVDETFNPTHERQAIGRAYRIGQKKHVYVYRLVVGGTFEEIMHNQSLFKEGLANRVVDRKDTVRNARKGVREWIFEPEEQPPQNLSEFLGADTLVLDHILNQQVGLPLVRSIKLAESFLVEEEEPLTAEEQREADEMEKAEQLRLRDPKAYAANRLREQMELLRPMAPSSGPLSSPYPLTVSRSNFEGNLNSPLHPLQPQQLVSNTLSLNLRNAPESPFGNEVGASLMNLMGQSQQQRETSLSSALPAAVTSPAAATPIVNALATTEVLQNLSETTYQIQPILGSGVMFDRPGEGLEELNGAAAIAGPQSSSVIPVTAEQESLTASLKPHEHPKVHAVEAQPETIESDKDVGIPAGLALDGIAPTLPEPHDSVPGGGEPPFGRVRKAKAIEAISTFVKQRCKELAFQGKSDEPLNGAQLKSFAHKFEKLVFGLASQGYQRTRGQDQEFDRRYHEAFEKLKADLSDDDILLDSLHDAKASSNEDSTPKSNNSLLTGFNFLSSQGHDALSPRTPKFVTRDARSPSTTTFPRNDARSLSATLAQQPGYAAYRAILDSLQRPQYEPYYQGMGPSNQARRETDPIREDLSGSTYVPYPTNSNRSQVSTHLKRSRHDKATWPRRMGVSTASGVQKSNTSRSLATNGTTETIDLETNSNEKEEDMLPRPTDTSIRARKNRPAHTKSQSPISPQDPSRGPFQGSQNLVDALSVPRMTDGATEVHNVGTDHID